MPEHEHAPDHGETGRGRIGAGLATRWLGVGLAAILAVVTIGLTATGRLSLYINPDSAWFAVGMSLVLLLGALASFLVPLGEETEHGHDHGGGHGGGRGGLDHGHDHDPAHEQRVGVAAVRPAAVAGRIAVVSGGVIASGIVVGMLVLPPASLSVELAQSRDVGAAPLFADGDTITLAQTGDTASFGVGDWASVFATATNPDAFDGDRVELTGFVSGGTADGFDLSRLVITHCVIDAQTATLHVATGAVTDTASEGASGAATAGTGEWVRITGTVSSSGGTLQVVATEVAPIDEPSDPYEY